MIIKLIIAGIIGLLFGILAVLSEERMKDTRSVEATLATFATIGAYCASMFVVFE